MTFVDPGAWQPGLGPNIGMSPAPSLGPAADAPSLGPEGPPPPNPAMQQAAEIMQRRQTAVAPYERAAVQAGNELAATPVPQLNRQPPKMTEKDAQTQNEEQAWLTAAMFLGTLGGALTRQPLTNALSAFSGVIEGAKQKDEQEFKRNLEVWDRENKAFEEANKYALEQYKATLQSREINWEQKQFALQVQATQLKHQAMIEALKTGNPEVPAQLVDQLDKHGRGAGQAYRATRADLARTMAQQTGRTRAASEAGELQAQNIYAGTEQPPSPNQRSPDVYWYNQYLMERVRQIGQEKGVPYNSLEWNRNRSMATGEGGVLGRAGGNIELVMQSAQPVIQLAADAVGKIPQTKFPILNQQIQSGMRQFGDEDERKFALAHLELEGVLARAINSRSSVIPVSFWNSAKEALDKATSREAYIAQLHYVEELVQRENAAVGRAQRKEPIPPVTYPKETTSATIPGAAADVGKRAEAAAESGVPGAKGAWEATHPHLPDWLRLPEGWTGKILGQ